MRNLIPPLGEVRYFLDGEELHALAGQMVAAAILASGRRILRHTRFEAKPRGIFCGIGICFDCLVLIDGIPNQRACIVEIKEGMQVATQQGAGTYPPEEKA